MGLTRIFFALLSFASVAIGQVVTGPTNSTQNSIPTFTDTSGKRISSSGTNFVWAGGQVRLYGASPGVRFYNTNGAFNAKSFEIDDALGQLRFVWNADDLGSASVLGYVAPDGNWNLFSISLSGQPNLLTITNATLFLDGVPVSSSSSQPITNFYSISNFFQVAKGGHLTISNSITILTNGTFILQNLPLPAVLVVGTNGIVTNATLSGLTLSDNGLLSVSSAGDTTYSNIVTLTMSGTNVSQLDFSLVQGGGIFKLNLTNNGYVGVPANVATSPFRKAWLQVQNAGGFILQFTNGNFCWSQKVAPVIDTNAGSVSVFEFITDLFTNGLVHGSVTALSGVATNM